MNHVESVIAGLVPGFTPLAKSKGKKLMVTDF